MSWTVEWLTGSDETTAAHPLLAMFAIVSAAVAPIVSSFAEPPTAARLVEKVRRTYSFSSPS